jgi:amino acid transporter
MGILSIVFGSLVALFSIFGLFSTEMMMGMPSGPEAEEFDAVFGEFMEKARVPQLISGVLMVGMSIALIAIGIGQVKYRRWAAQASVMWGVAALVVLVIIGIMQVTMLGPAFQAFFDEVAATDPEAPSMAGFGSMAGAFSLAGLVVYLPYPILMIVFFRKLPVVESMVN